MYTNLPLFFSLIVCLYHYLNLFFQDSCDDTPLLDESEYIYNIDHQHRSFNVTVAFMNTNPLQLANGMLGGLLAYNS